MISRMKLLNLLESKVFIVVVACIALYAGLYGFYLDHKSVDNNTSSEKLISHTTPGHDIGNPPP